MLGKRILHYDIQEKLGQGGMGEVFLARDTKLGRDVALKFLPASHQADREARARLLREAQAVSKLIHANIVAIHAIEHADNNDFIVMEYVRGESLDEVIASRAITVRQAIAYARELVDALSLAHSEGVVHRDIKTSNVIISERGQAKMLDFGLATFSGATQLTEAGSTMGTMAYMAPEQIEGGKIDHRSDLFSIGVVFYEMIAGRRPFDGATRATLAHAIQTRAPEPLARYKSDVPDEVQRIIEKALRKNPDERYQSAADMLADLRALDSDVQSGSVSATPAVGGVGAGAGRTRLLAGIGIAVVVVAAAALIIPRIGGKDNTATTGIAPLPPVPSPVGVQNERVMIAVLPFRNVGAAEDEYFAEGISEEITARLATVDGLGVIARTSVAQYRETTKTMQQIGGELGVNYVLEGTVRWQKAAAGGQGESRVRVTPQLIRVADATHMWADIYDEPMTAVFQVQSNIAQNVVRELGIALLEPQKVSMAESPTTNMEAYDYYLRGRNELNETGAFDERSLRTAQQMFERAIELDPSFGLAYTELSRVHSDMYWFHSDRTEERVLRAKSTAETALELKPDSPEAHAAMAWYWYHGRSNYKKALESFGRALAGRPNDAAIVAGIGFVERRQGRFEEGLVHLRRALVLDPQSSEAAFSVGETLTLLRRFDEARPILEKGVEQFPGHEFVRVQLGYAYLRGYGDIAAARRVLEEAYEVRNSRVPEYELHRLELAARDYTAALRWTDAFGQNDFDDQFVYRPVDFLKGVAYALMGQNDRAQEHFVKSRDRMKELIAKSPDDPRYHSALGETYARLGQRDLAIKHGRRGEELQAFSDDAMKAPERIASMARIYTILGELDQAIAELDRLISVVSYYTPMRLRLEPEWDPLRDDTRFQKLAGTQ